MSKNRRQVLARERQPPELEAWEQWEEWVTKVPQRKIRRLRERIMRPVLAKAEFRADLERARNTYVEHAARMAGRPESEQKDDSWLEDAILELRRRYGLSQGWVPWLGRYIIHGDSDPLFLHLWRVCFNEDSAGGRYAQLEVYFPLPRWALSQLLDTYELESGEYDLGYPEQEQAGAPSLGEVYDRIARIIRKLGAKSEWEYQLNELARSLGEDVSAVRPRYKKALQRRGIDYRDLK